MSRLIVAYIIEKDEDLFELSYNSIKDVADEVLIINGNKDLNNPKYNFLAMVGEKPTTITIWHPYPHEDKGANGKQRNVYLNNFKKFYDDEDKAYGPYKGDWVLVLDADEVVDHPERIKETIELLEQQNIDCADVHMRHCVGNLGQEDSTVKQHFVPTRLFKISKDIFYDEAEHVCLNGAKKHSKVASFCIWHLGYSREIFNLRKKYLNHKEKSNIHKSGFLEWWYHSHLLGEFPASKVNSNELPKIIKDHFQIDEDYLYFKDRGFELKHAECVKQWKEYFQTSSVLDLGCGRGPYLRYWEMTERCSTQGIELSQWAIDNKLCKTDIKQVDILNPNLKKIMCNEFYSLVTAIDLLEHLEEKDLQKALKNIYNVGHESFLFSIPFEGDPNLYADPTHKIFKPKEWWLEQLTKAGFKIKETPEHFYFKEQMVVATK